MKLGDKVKDKVTGFEGIVVAIDEWLNGCRRAGVQAKMKKDGTFRDPAWIDESQLTILKRNAMGKPKSKYSPVRGGPRPKKESIYKK